MFLSFQLSYFSSHCELFCSGITRYIQLRLVVSAVTYQKKNREVQMDSGKRLFHSYKFFLSRIFTLICMLEVRNQRQEYLLTSISVFSNANNGIKKETVLGY